MTGFLRHHDFSQHVGKLFDFDGGRAALRLAVIDVEDNAVAPSAGRTPFTLIFHGPVAAVLPEGLYSAEVEGGSVVTLYVMPIHTTAVDRQDYQAVFN
jgi:hypothetical protein